MTPTRVKCPTCRRELDWNSAPFRPFCSERCRLIDLGAWLTEQRAIPAESSATAERADAEEPQGKSAS
ncbi:MAG TPA: DNA gyrase inhibitor YacG [Candidatus Dormibacteraeota bacterium]|nr:DNA gyrase inhibitor YacG [Candidatus Dormibacteraeota bacterium]